MTAAPLLEADGLAVHFGGVLAVDGVSLAVADTGTTCIVGPNGAGKSTLFNMLSGTVRPSAGRVRLAGSDITGRRIETFANILGSLANSRPRAFSTDFPCATIC